MKFIIRVFLAFFLMTGAIPHPKSFLDKCRNDNIFIFSDMKKSQYFLFNRVKGQPRLRPKMQKNRTTVRFEISSIWRATAGFEPATHGLGNHRSILLSYGRATNNILTWDELGYQYRHAYHSLYLPSITSAANPPSHPPTIFTAIPPHTPSVDKPHAKKVSYRGNNNHFYGKTNHNCARE